MVGGATVIFGVFLPLVEPAIFGMSLARSGILAPSVFLVILGVTSIVIASLMLLRRTATTSIAGILIVLAVAQLGFAAWSAMNIGSAIAAADSHQVLIDAIGTGAYACVLGSLLSLAGGAMAWFKRDRAADILSG